MARPERFELPTNWFEASYSIQLSYGRSLGKAPFCPKLALKWQASKLVHSAGPRRGLPRVNLKEPFR